MVCDGRADPSPSSFWVHDYVSLSVPAANHGVPRQAAQSEPNLYPYVLPASMAQPALTVSQVASSPESMTVALFWWIPGMILVGVYTYFVYSKLLPRFS
jgi:hypothetical protein